MRLECKLELLGSLILLHLETVLRILSSRISRSCIHCFQWVFVLHQKLFVFPVWIPVVWRKPAKVTGPTTLPSQLETFWTEVTVLSPYLLFRRSSLASLKVSLSSPSRKRRISIKQRICFLTTGNFTSLHFYTVRNCHYEN